MSLLYSDRGNLSLGFHGCKKSVAIALISTPDVVKFSKNDWDWLGSGFYIWENNYERAKEWADAQYGNEGAKIPGMEIYEKTHIQIAIRNLNCIKGFFLPRTEITFP